MGLMSKCRVLAVTPPAPAPPMTMRLSEKIVVGGDSGTVTPVSFAAKSSFPLI